MAFTLGTDQNSLMAQRANILAEINKRGGKASAPEYASRLEQVDNALSTMRQGTAAPAPGGQAPQPAPIQPSPGGYVPPAPQPAPPQFDYSKLPPDFDPEEYYRLNPDVKAAGVGAAEHYLANGMQEGRTYRQAAPNPITVDNGGVPVPRTPPITIDPGGVIPQPRVPQPPVGDPPPDPRIPTDPDGPGPYVPDNIPKIGIPQPPITNDRHDLPPISQGPNTQLPSDETDVTTVPGGPIMNPNDRNPVVANPGPGPNPITGPIDPTKVKQEEDARALKRAQDILMQGEQTGRRIADEFYGEGALGRMSETLTPGEQAALDMQKHLSDTAGLQSPEVRDLLTQQQGILHDARNLTPLETNALEISKAGLLGIDQPEIRAMRSQAKEQINREMMGQARELAKAQVRGQVFGGAATAQRRLLGQDSLRAGRNLERDLIVANIDAKQKARDSFAGLTTNTEANRSNRTDAANRAFSATTLEDEDNRRRAKMDSNEKLGNLSNAYGESIRKLKQFNIDQAAAEKAGRIGSIFGGMGMLSEQRGLFAGEEFAGLQFDEQQRVSDQIIALMKKSLKAQNGALA